MRNRGFGNQQAFKIVVSGGGRQPVITARPGMDGLNANNTPAVNAPAVRNPFQRKQG